MAKRYMAYSARMLGLDKQIQKLDSFDKLFNELFQPAVDKAVRISAAHAVELSPKGKTNRLSTSIKIRKMRPTQYEVKGRIVVTDSPDKANAMERGRSYTRNGSKYKWVGKWYLAYGVRDNRDYITKLYAISAKYLMSLLSVNNAQDGST
jgi:hypothetical protein